MTLPADLTDKELDQLILSEYPYPIAVNYRRLLETETWEARTRKCIEVFDFGLRAITLGVLSQYLIRDVHDVSDPELDRKLYRNLSKASLGQWTEFLFLCLRAYRGKRKVFFMPELYDFYWDTSRESLQPRKGIRNPFNRLVQIRNDLAHSLPPASEGAWEELGRETLSHLRTILANFSFLQNYDLVRVIGRHDTKYEYERYTGQEITTHREKLRGRRELRTGWFYLSRQDRSVLQLHPLLISWDQSRETTLDDVEQRDAAVYDKLLHEAVGYVALVVQQVVEEHDADLIAQFRQLLHYNIEHIKMARKRTVLSWDALRRAAEEHATEEMGAVREKYQQALYLQRDETFSIFQQFLASDKGCFVLSGKSGVGKSNFVLSLADEFADRQDLCLLLYNGARLSASDSLVRTISQDLAKYLTLEGEETEDLFSRLEQRGEMTGKTMLLVFDAINENADGKALLRRIDQMVGDVRYRWFKVLITSRPQAWRTLNRGLRLAEDRYFREPGSDDYWVELQEFTIKLESFKRQELPEVYQKYKEIYGLQTEFEVLKSPIQKALRDPLMLRLIAEIHRGQPIPERIRISDIYEQYVQTLVMTERLYEEDIIFLERELMPLMLAQGHYDNKITASQIHKAETRDERPLWELIHNDDLLSNGRRVNDSYVRLVDAEILAEQGAPTDYEIAFKYERFYDYYGGERLLGLIDQSEETREETYRKLTQALQDHAFLWGSIKTSLVAELSRNNKELFIHLAKIPDDTTAKLLVTALSEYGHDAPEIVLPILDELATLEEEMQQRWWRYRRPSEISTSLFTARKVCIETATNLELENILVTTACDSSASVRMHTVQHIHRLWNQDDEVALQTLTSLSRQIKTRLGIPRSNVLESVVGASALIAFEHYRNPAAMTLLQQLWRGILEQLLFMRDTEGGPEGELRRRVRGIAVFLLSRLLVRLMYLLPSGSNLNVPELKHFFTMDSNERQRFRELLPFLDPNYHHLNEARVNLIEAAKSRDILTLYLVWLTLVGRGLKSPEEIIPLVEPLFRESLELDPPGPAVQAVFGALADGLASHPEFAHQTVELMRAFFWSYYDKSNGVYWTDLQAYQHSNIEGFIIQNYQVKGTYYPDGLLEQLNKEKQLGDFRLHRLFVGFSIHSESSIGALDVIAALGHPILALRVAEVLTDVDDDLTRKGLYEFLARLSKSHKDEVYDFIDEFNLKTDSFRQAEATMTAQTIGDIVFLTAISFLTKIHAQPVVFHEVQALMQGMLACNSVDRFIELFIKRIINFVYGSPVFDIPGSQSQSVSGPS